jgi:RNA polymerase sigma factor (sigma-70 family)
MRMKSETNPVRRLERPPGGRTAFRRGQKFLDDAIRSLPESLRIVFLLRDVEGLSIRETAEALNLTETNVKTRLLRARMALREGLSAYYGERFIREKSGTRSER